MATLFFRSRGYTDWGRIGQGWGRGWGRGRGRGGKREVGWLVHTHLPMSKAHTLHLFSVRLLQVFVRLEADITPEPLLTLDHKV